FRNVCCIAQRVSTRHSKPARQKPMFSVVLKNIDRTANNEFWWCGVLQNVVCLTRQTRTANDFKKTKQQQKRSQIANAFQFVFQF
ncbi:MAG: hypothetical protein ACI4QH_02360, partial [Candidatus Fimimonas sp.]